MIGQTVSHYKILEKLGEGGMGVVYKALDISLDRTVALKLLPPRAVVTDDDRARFANEARAAAKLSHPHIATVYEFGEAEAQTFLAMEFIDGRSLRKKIQQGLLPVAEVLRIAREAASGLAVAHEHGIIHRDVKSENIMLTPDGSAKIMDFGLAQVRGQSRLWKSGETVGTVSYMSPEQARGEHLDERTDIWSLGVVIYEMLTGKLPFPGEYESAVLYLIIHEQPQPIKTIRDDVPTMLQEIVLKCLEKEAERRYQKATELLAEVNALQKQLETGIEERQEKPVEEKRFETERRPVTVLHAAIVSGGAEELDPEALTAGLDECIDGLIGIIEKYDGMADRVFGDRLMAVFGAPIAHENDPERAIRCAHEMMSYVLRVTALGMSQASTALQLKIGIHTGVVIAGNVGAAGKSGYSVVGDAINVAAGIVDVVSTGKISLSSDAYKLVAGMVDVGEPRMITVRGKTPELKVFDLRSLKLGAEPGRRQVGGGAFVGRIEELKLFEEAIEQVQKNAEVRLFIRGEPGVGKTRLKNEMVTRARRRQMSVIEGKCSSFEVNTPYYLWNTFLKSLLRVEPDTPESEVRSRLHEMVKVLALDPDEPYLASLLSLRSQEILLEEDEERRTKMYHAAQRLLKAYAERKHAVFVLEDLHWIDRFSQTLLVFMLKEHQVAPALIVCLFRPEYREAEGFVETEREFDLDRLPAVQAHELMRLRFNAESIPDQLASLIEQRSEGNPFFIEEIIKTLLDKGIVSVKKGKLAVQTEKLESGVPETLQGVILARIDQLEGRIREVLLNASVIGREFSRPVLEHVIQKRIDVGAGLKKLESLELVFEKEEARELEYLFKHYLIQEVAYNTLLQKKRKQLHGMIAGAIEKLYAERLKEFYEVLAFHYERAEEWQKAAEYLSRAGNKVREIYTKEESKDFFERKEVAKAKLLHAPGARSRMMIVYRVVFGLLFIVYFGFVGWLVFAFAAKSGREVWQIGLQVGMVLFFLVLGLWSTAKTLQTLRSRPTLFELFEDRVEMLFDNGTSYSVMFSDIFLVHFYTRKTDELGQRWWTRLWADLRPRGFEHDYRLSFNAAIAVAKETVNPYSFGFGSKKGEIHIRKKSGESFASKESQLKPWKIGYARERDIAITPEEPKEFYSQLMIALAKWKRGHEPEVSRTHSENPDGPPLLLLRPVFHLIPALCSLNALAYVIVFEIVIILFSAMVGVFNGKFIPTDLIPTGTFFLLFGTALWWFVKIRQEEVASLFEFYTDRMVFSIPGRRPLRGTIFYEVLEGVEHTGRLFRKIFKIGDLVVRTHSILRVNALTKIAVTGLIIPDIEKPEQVLEMIHSILVNWRKGNEAMNG